MLTDLRIGGCGADKSTPRTTLGKSTQPTPVNSVSLVPLPQLVAAPILQLAIAPIGSSTLRDLFE
uniref:Uncharacterized protein n=1 Tax=Romanomermis culicivorax TaxID=13658 RepID=A0A915KNF5_ROMCU